MILKKLYFILFIGMTCVAVAQSEDDKRVCIFGRYRIMYKLSDAEIIQISINGVVENSWLRENNMWNILSIRNGKKIEVKILDFNEKEYYNFNCSDVVITNLSPAKTFKAIKGIVFFKVNKSGKSFSVKIKNAIFKSIAEEDEVKKIKKIQFYGSTRY